MKNWDDVTLPIAERKKLILSWAKKKGIPKTKAELIANKRLSITAYDTEVVELLDELDDAISCIDTDDHTEWINLYDVNDHIKTRLYRISDALRELIEQ